jgi:predicted RNase H-like HicB family nuclease
MIFTADLQLEGGSYWAQVRELPGCFASGCTLDEPFEALREAIDLCQGGDDPAENLRIASAVLSSASEADLPAASPPPPPPPAPPGIGIPETQGGGQQPSK